MSDTLGAVLREMTRMLAGAGIEDPAREAAMIASHGLGWSMARIATGRDAQIEAAQHAQLMDLAARRATRRPLAQVLGRRAFYNHDFLVTDQVLDPRPETEALVRAALDGPVGRVLDLGTGSGAIVLSILSERPDASGLGTDLSPAALAVARENARRLGLGSRCDFTVSDWFEGVTGGFDLIVSNPPYIAAAEMAAMAPELHHEPRMALTDEGDGLSAYRAITAEAGAHLVPGGQLMVEIGWTQGAEVMRMFRRAGFGTVRIWPDLDGRDRVVSGIWHKNSDLSGEQG